MNLADVFTFLFVILGFVIVFVSYWLMAAGLFPQFVERASERFDHAPARLGVLGLLTLVPLLFIGAVLSSKAPNGAGKILALSLVVLPLLASLFGSAGLALRIGAGLKSTCDEAQPWRRTLRGGIVLGLTFVLPVIGTFLVLPYALLGGFGAFILCARRRRPAPEAVSLPVAMGSPASSAL